ncbi:MAG TPA: DUF1641 domain-containing protein [Pirellulaceae bacterium]|nr:DUF1641 domain-containing protein [Pirellulaceae bacterium]HMO92821.1 DUF1641 domain-containing protein [Pirellulaceae bacterium]HMP69436.1 DUF1641 domain-containing protein [Pirellulaceae bacterium]
MNTSPAGRTLEDALFARMGITVDDALATATDIVDEQVKKAGANGVDVQANLQRLGDVLARLTEPDVIVALDALIERLPQLAQLLRLSDELPKMLGMLTDIIDEYETKCAESGIDVERSISNGVHAALWLGSQVDQQDLQRIGRVLKNDVLGEQALGVVGRAARSLGVAASQVNQTKDRPRIGLLGLLKAMKDPQIQTCLAFAIKFGESFAQQLQEYSLKDPA